MQIVYLSGEVSDEWFKTLLKAPKHCVVIINSSGGSTSDSRACATQIKILEATTVAAGSVDSAAIPVWASGKTRLAYEGTTFLWHAPYVDIAEGTSANARQCTLWANNLSRWVTWASSILASRSSRLSCLWRADATAEGREFIADDFQDFGLVHQVISDLSDLPFELANPAGDVGSGEESCDEDADDLDS